MLGDGVHKIISVMSITVAIDRGGTFTDVYARKGDNEFILKLLSVNSNNYEDAPIEGIRQVLEYFTGSHIPKGAKLDLTPIESVRMGTTIATNGLLERDGERVALLVTKGFRDILSIGLQARPNIFDLKVSKLESLYEVVYEIDERVVLEQASEVFDISPIDWENPSIVKGLDGGAVRVIRKPDLNEVAKTLRHILDMNISSLAISFMHSFTYPEHELLVAKLAREVGFKHISISSTLQPMIKYVARSNSVTADAYLSPLIVQYLKKLSSGIKGGLETAGDKIWFMQSDGGLTRWDKFSGLKAVLSGPAGGAVGYAKTSFKDKPVLGFDMGGTSTDVSRYDGRFEHVYDATIAEITIQAPQLNIQTVAAGGGSILSWKKGLFLVGPSSASANPGPACYRKGGPLTVTDANLLLGRISVESFPHIFGPNNDAPLDEAIVRQKFQSLANEINAELTGSPPLTAEEIAYGFLTVANETMCRPIRALTDGRGHSSSDHILASFGGASGQHAYAVAQNLGIEVVLVHRYSSILSAYGIALADVIVEVQEPASSTLSQDNLLILNSRLDELEQKALHKLEDQGLPSDSITMERFLNLKYTGSESCIMVMQKSGSSFESDFKEAHLKAYGFSCDREIEVGDIRVRATVKSTVRSSSLPQLEGIEHTKRATSKKTKSVYFAEGWLVSAIFAMSDLQVGSQIVGPALVFDSTQTIIIPPAASAIMLPEHIVLKLPKAARTTLDSRLVNPIQLSVFSHRFMSIAEQMGRTLQRTAISTNIKERLDYSCAIFGSDGALVANAPHIPVHLGSMSAAVTFQKEIWANNLTEGDVLVANHPAFGGSHLPDITVITPVFSSNRIVFWVASRGHHSDIGGITAGSMPPYSSKLWEEGAIIKGFKIVRCGVFDEDGLRELLLTEPAKYPNCSGSRCIETNIADLKAQIAANNRGIFLLQELVSKYSLEVVQLYMQAIRDNAECAVRELLKSVALCYGSYLHADDYLDDGSQICLSININELTGDATFDFAGTGVQLFGNLNAHAPITYSAILYCLRTMISEDIPLNQGCLEPVTVRIPPGSLLRPSSDAATVGGNVETSQRIVDVIFRAFKAVAGSQGTCNNLSFGVTKSTKKDGKLAKSFGYYETIGGGAGAGPSWNGQSGVQVHMTNTRATDPEILEHRYPVILHKFALREGSNGHGEFSGGMGIIRDIEFRYPVQVSILSERRAIAPYGLNGGEPGMTGENLLIHDGLMLNLGGKITLDVCVGDHIIVKTPGGGGFGTPKSKLR